MVELVVSAEQAKLLQESRDSVEIVDAQGNRLGFFARRFSADDVEIAKARAATPEPRRSTADVLGRLRSAEAR